MIAEFWVTVCVSARLIWLFCCNFVIAIWGIIQVVQGIISELESQGALPRSNSRVSSLATCCGPRLVQQLVIGLVSY